MKKILFILMVFLGIALTADAQKRSCPVYGNPNYSVKVLNGSTLAEGNEYGKATTTIYVQATGPVNNTPQDIYVYVYVSAYTRTAPKAIVDTKRVRCKICRGEKTSSYTEVPFDRLSKGVTYEVGIDEASCE